MIAMNNGNDNVKGKTICTQPYIKVWQLTFIRSIKIIAFVYLALVSAIKSGHNFGGTDMAAILKKLLVVQSATDLPHLWGVMGFP